MNYKKKESKEVFTFNWVLVNRLAMGSAPKSEGNIKILKSQNINSILSLCSEEEAPLINNLHFNFKHHKIVLPDHKSDKNISQNQIKNSLKLLNSLYSEGNVFIHCYAGIERSPLICIAWLIESKKLKFIDAIEYIRDIHPYSAPLQSHLNILKKINFDHN